MNKLKTSVFIIFCCIAISCSSDDNNDTSQNQSDSLAGVYNITSVFVVDPVDFNQDGTASNNLMLENTCYGSSYITLYEDGTFDSEFSNPLLTGDTFECTLQEGEGTWTYENNTIVLTNTFMEPATIVTYTVPQIGSLNITYENFPYPDRDEEDNPVYTAGDVQLTYTKL